MKEGWKYVKLDSITEIVGRIGFRGYTKADLVNSPQDGAITLSPSNIINGELNFDKCSYINWDKYYESPEIMLEKGDVVLVKTASIGKCAYVRFLPHEATLNPQFVVFKNIKINAQFLTYYLKAPTVQKQILLFAGGVAIPTLSQKKIGTLDVPMPPLSEQQQIVDFLDAEFAKIDELKNQAEQSLQNAKDLFQAALKEMLTPKEGWKEQVLGSLGESKVGPFGSLLHKKDYIENGTPLINPMHIGNGKIKPDTSFSVSKEKLLELQSFVMLENDIVIGRRGEMGRCAVVTKAEEGFVCGTGSIYFRPNTKKVLPLFLQLYLSSDLGKSELEKVAGGATMLNLSSKALNGLVISIPSIERQIEVIDKLNDLKQKVNTLQSNYTRTIQLCADLKQALLRQVFE